jgi:hypothetical protein
MDRSERIFKNHSALEGHSSESKGGLSLKRLRIPGFIDIINVDDPKEIIELNRDPRIDRKFDLRSPIFNWLILKRSLTVLSFHGSRFPTMVARDSATRASGQAKLGAALNAKASSVREGPEELEPLASWIRGEGSDSDVGLFVQQILGRLFSSTFVATRESWDAAKTLVAAPRSPNWLKTLWWFLSGKVRRAKRLLTSMVNQDLSAVNAIGIASHNIVKSLVEMKRLYSDPSVRSSLSAEEAARQSLMAPVSIFRQPNSAGELRGCPFSKNSLFVFAIGKASKADGGRSLVFMDDSWSGCPASQWVPAMLEGVWSRAERQRLNERAAR